MYFCRVSFINFNMKIRLLFLVLLLWAIGWGKISESFAQNYGVVKGRIFDVGNNDAIPFANVVIY